MSKIFQKVSQIVFLLLFLFLLKVGKVQVWLVIFVGSVILALLSGRFYCGWICPINTLIGNISKVKKRLGIKEFYIPRFLKKPLFRNLVLIIFIITFIFVIISGKKLPVLPFLFLMGIALTLFFPESMWHRYLCPYGSILGMTGSKAKRYLKIDSGKCIQCGICARACPGDAVLNHNEYFIDKSLCLICFKCVNKCPMKTIHF